MIQVIEAQPMAVADTASERRQNADPPDAATSYTVQQAAELTGLSEHTLRYYERIGMLQPVQRDRSSGHRRYSAADLGKLDTMACLRAIGMPLEQMRAYMQLRSEGPLAAARQRALLEQHQQVLERRLRAAQRHLSYVQHKIVYWQAIEDQDDQAAAIAKERSRRVLQEDQ